MRTYSLLGKRGIELLIDAIDLCHGKRPRTELQELIAGKLRELLPHDGFAYGVAEVARGTVLSHTNVSMPSQYFEAARDDGGIVRCPLVTRWVKKRQPVWYEQRRSGKTRRGMSRQQHEAFHDLYLRHVALHGMANSSGTAGWYAFARLEDKRCARSAALLRLVTPHLHAVLACPLAPKNSAQVIALSRRERTVLQWLARGKTNEQIGALLHVSPLTIKTHVQHIAQKLAATNRTHAVIKAAQMGIIELRDVVL